MTLHGWYKHYQTMHYHANRTEDGFASGVPENIAQAPGNVYQYGANSDKPNVLSSSNSALDFGQIYDPNFYTISPTFNTESHLTELFRSNVSRSYAGKLYVTPIPVLMSASASTLARLSGFGKIWPVRPKVLDRNE